MQPGRSSRTAELVCMGRAVAQGSLALPAFDDPTAIELLSPEARHFRRRARRPRVAHAGARGRRRVRGRSPDSQREKRSRLGALRQAAREVRFVPVDFEQDSLENALAAAGHDTLRPTTWVWEGVVMYLAPADVDATLATISRRSSAGSRLIVLYHSPALILRLVGLIVGRIGEPLKSAFTAEAMRARLAKHGFNVVHDGGIHELSREFAPSLASGTQFVNHLRIATADRVA